jgi:ferrous iron transport protein B
MIKAAPMGDPLEIRVRGYVLTLRKSDASKIHITDIHDKHLFEKRNKSFSPIEHTKIGENNQYISQNQKKQPKKNIMLALAGNQNCGKTLLFNRLTGMNRRVGNFPGVTVDSSESAVKGYQDVNITDLPGIYSLSPYSKEEIVTRNFLLQQKVDGILNIIDATNIERNLFLTLQLLELKIPMVIALNMMDEVSQNGGSIDINRLEATLGVPVIPISALKNEGIEELTEHIVNVSRYNVVPQKADFCGNGDDSKSGAVHRCIHSIIHLIEDHAKSADIPVRFAATKIAEGDELILNSLNLDKKELKTFEQIISTMEKECCLDSSAALADMRFSFIENLCENFVFKPNESIGYMLSARADKILTGKYTAMFAFLGIMSLIFFITFGPVGTFCSDCMEYCINWFIDNIDILLTNYCLNPVVKSLLIDGVFAGVGSVLSFLPVIVILFFFLSLMEDSGYMARVAFVMDKLLRKIGLSGRSFVPMLIGFGCSVPAIMATRTLPSERDRKMTIFLTPFMSCSAKLPIYALFTAAFFKENQVVVVLSLYLIGIIVGIISAFIMNLFFKGNAVPFVMELPNYRIPGIVNVFRLIYSKAKDFITKAFTVIFVATIVIWFLQTFDAKLNLVSDSSQSLLASLGSFFVPIFKPLGITDWRISTAFLTGFMAKESVVSTLTVLIGGDTDNLPLMFTKLSAFVFLVFSLLYTPCVAAIATVKKELGTFYAIAVVLLQCLIAWIVAFIFYNIGVMIF